METSVNNKCRAFTSLEQSKKLAEILPLESADMHFVNDKHAGCVPYLEITNGSNPWLKGTDISPCWSLAVLLGVLPSGYVIVKNYHNFYYVESRDHSKSTNIFENPVDACVAMIEKLHELKIL